MHKILGLLLAVVLLVNDLPALAAIHRITPAQKIQDAIDRAREGDTLLLTTGIYQQHQILVNKKLALIGEGWPVLDGEGKQELIYVDADSVYINGLQVQNTGFSGMTDMAGIKVQNSSGVVITNCRFLKTTYGVYLQNSSGCSVVRNYFMSNAVSELSSGNGIHAWKCSRLWIAGNVISGHRDGIYFEFVTHSHVHKNRTFGNIRYGLHFMFSHNDVYSYNVFQNNGAGVAVMYTKHVTMLHNRFYRNWGEAAYGLLLKEISDSKMEHNVFDRNTVAILMEGATRVHVARNIFKDNGWAMRVQASSEQCIIEQNNFFSNSFDVATNGTMMLNKWQNNYWDKYEGYDLDRNGTGDVPYYPVSLYSVITEKIPAAMILYRSLLTNLLDQAEKMMPSITPDQLKDDSPKMKPWPL